jgi:hypothetical protein
MASVTPIQTTPGLLERVHSALRGRDGHSREFARTYINNLTVSCEVIGATVKIRFVNAGENVSTARIFGVLGRFCRIGALGNLDRELVGEPSDGSQYPAKSVDLAKYELNLLLLGSEEYAAEAIKRLNEIDDAVRRCIYDNWDALREAAEAQLGKKKVWVLGKTKPDTYEEFCALIKSYTGRHYKDTLATPEGFLNPEGDKKGWHIVRGKDRIAKPLAPGENPALSAQDPLINKVAGLIEQMPPCPKTGRRFGLASLLHTDYNGNPISPSVVERITTSNKPFYVLVTYQLPFNLELGKPNVYFPTQLRPKGVQYMYTEKEILRVLDGGTSGPLSFNFVPPGSPTKRAAEEPASAEAKRPAPAAPAAPEAPEAPEAPAAPEAPEEPEAPEAPEEPADKQTSEDE